MKRAITLGIGALALAGMTVPTAAADLGARPIAKAPIAAPVPVFSWTGCYIGGQAGGKWGDNDLNANLAAVPVLLPGGGVVVFNGNNDNNVGFIGGGQLGCQWQTGAWVFGIEGDFVATDIDRTFVVATPIGPFIPGDTFQIQNDWQASVRGRLGYAFDRLMIYGTGGVAFANVEATVGLVGLGTFSASKTLTGWTAGGGFEYAFTNNFSLGVEYRFSSFDTENFAVGCCALSPVVTSALAVNSELQTHEVTARLNWKFYPWGGGF